MKRSINLLFYQKKQKNYRGGPIPIYLMITVNGKRAEIARGKTFDPKQWNSETGRMSGNKVDAQLLNSHLNALYINFQNVHSELIRTGQTVTSETIKHRFSGRITKPRFLLEVINDHNNRLKALVGQESQGTLKCYKVLKNHTAEFLKVQFGALHYDIQKIDVAFVTDYEFHLKSCHKMGNNAAVKHMKMFRKIINICLYNSWITKDPFSNFRGKCRKS